MFSKGPKLLAITVLATFLVLIFPIRASALENSFATIVNPVRGTDFWSLENQAPLEAVEKQEEVIEKYGFLATWLIRPDGLFDSEMVKFFKNFPQGHELGIFLEVTPSWANKAEIAYHKSVLWHYANSIFLSGYNLVERRKLIDRAFGEFNNHFGYYPKAVGAWHIDTNSLEYMRKKYGIEAALTCADQFLTDNYQIWGGWWGVPYYPSRYNVLIPAQSKSKKIEVVVLQWAARDPVNGYGGGVTESTFSVQANDYLKKGLDISYFSKLVDIYTNPGLNRFGQITIGLENDNPWDTYGQEYENQIKALANKNLSTLTMSGFADWYQKNFELSPFHQIFAVDPLGSQKKATWLMSIEGRLGIIGVNGEQKIIDRRVYNENWPEPYLDTANPESNLRLSLPATIDSIRFPAQALDLKKPIKQDLLKQPSFRLPFSTSWYVYWLAIILILVFLFLAFRLTPWLAILMFFGVFSQTITMIKSGLLYRYGLGFWGPNGHDGIWHLALINNLTHHFPPQNPVFGGKGLFNYHYFFDLGVALVHKITGLSAINLYFQILPIILSSLLGILTFLFVKKLVKNNLSPLLCAFFAYFGGNFGWIVTLARGQGLAGESMFWANQATSFLINPPFAMSVILILWGLCRLIDYQKRPTLKATLILSLIFGLLLGVKVYAGVVIIGGLLVAATWELAQEHKSIWGGLFFGCLVVSLAVFIFTTRKALSLLVISPLWFSRTLLGSADRFNWVRLDQARQAYLATGKWVHWFLAEGLAVFIFFVGNLGVRIFGLGKIFSSIKKIKNLTPQEIFFLTVIALSGLIPLVFIQKGNPWNTIQFFYYFLMFMGIFSGIWIGEFLKNKKQIIKALLITLVIVLSLPTTIATLKHYLPWRAPARISFDELEALDFLRRQKEGIILSYPYELANRDKFEAPKPLFAYETTAYISALSDKQSFLEDEMNLEIMGENWQPRRKAIEGLFESTSPREVEEFFKMNKISYLYLIGNQALRVGPEGVDLEKIFENGLVRIYQFRDKI